MDEQSKRQFHRAEEQAQAGQSAEQSERMVGAVLPEGAAETRLQAVGRHPRLGTMRTQ